MHEMFAVFKSSGLSDKRIKNLERLGGQGV